MVIKNHFISLKLDQHKKNIFIECLEYEKNDLNEKKLNLYESSKIDMDCKIKELIVKKKNLIEKINKALFGNHFRK